MTSYSFLFCVIVIVGVCKCNSEINLSDYNWTLSNERGYNNVSIPGAFPGDSFTDLMAANIIGDPYYRYNDENYRWISRDNWTYSAQINFQPSIFNEARIVLWFEGLDTISTIRINGKIIGESDNMFRRWIFDIKDFLDSSQSTITLSIDFYSSVWYGKYQAENTPYDIPQSTYQVSNPIPNLFLFL